MAQKKKEILINLFNRGKLKLHDAEWLYNRGFCVVCAGGKVIDIYRGY